MTHILDLEEKLCYEKYEIYESLTPTETDILEYLLKRIAEQQQEINKLKTKENDNI